MRHPTALVGLLAALPTAYGVAFGGPVPTDLSPARAMDVTGPEPTQGPLAGELMRRQANLNPATCGWVDGVFASGIVCTNGGTCMLYTSSASVGMAGCCSNGDTESCDWSNRCVDYSAFAAGSCGASCQQNDFVRKCTNALRPYCVTWTYPGDNVADYGCAATSANTIYRVLQHATDSVGDTTSMTLPTVSGGAITGLATATSNNYSGGSSDGTSSRTVKKIAIGLIVGVVIAALFVIFFVAIGVVFCLKKKRKQRQLEANAQIVATAQANRPQSMYPPHQQQPPPMQMQQAPPPMAQQNGFLPPQSPYSPQPTTNGYFAPPGQNDQKYNGHGSVQEYAVTPISNPPTPAPAYAQPNGGSAAPPMPTQPTMHAHYHTPADGTFEADSTGIAHPPPQQVVSPISPYHSPVPGAHEVHATNVAYTPSNGKPVYEMGQER